MSRKTVLRPDSVKEDKLEDADGNTSVAVEDSENEDTIRFRTAGLERMQITETGEVRILEHVTIGEYTLPTTDGSANQVLTTDGAGNVTFQDQSTTGGLFIQGHVEVGSTTASPANWFNVVSIGSTAAAQFKSWFIAPYSGTITGLILSVKGNKFNTANDGEVRVKIYLNQPSFGSDAAALSADADDFTVTVSNFEGGTSDLNTKTLDVSPGISVAPGDLIQLRAEKTLGNVKDAVVTLLFS